MKTTLPKSSMPPRVATPSAAAEFAAALDRETEQVRALRAALLEQRAGVAAGAAERVNAATEAVGRVLDALGEARRRRIGLSETWAGGAPPDPAASHGRGGRASELERARLDLRRAALEVSHEIAINRVVLRRAVENGEAFLQALFSAVAEPVAVYAPTERAEDGAASGVLLDRQA